MGIYQNEIQNTGSDNGQLAGGGQQRNGANLYESAYPGAPGRSNQLPGQPDAITTNYTSDNGTYTVGNNTFVNNGNYSLNAGDGRNSGTPNGDYYGGNTGGNTNLGGDNYAVGNANLSGNTGNGADLANQGLTLIQQGDQYDGIMSLLGAEQANPGLVNNQAFLGQLQLVESNSTTGANPTGAANPGAITDAANPTASAGSQPDAHAMQALSDAQQNPTLGMLELMAAATANPNLVSDQNFLAQLQTALPGAQAAQPADASIQQTSASADPSQQTDVSASPAAPSNYTLPTQLTDTTNDPQSADPTIQTALQQALTLIAQGDQADAALLLMQIAQADPAILQDKVFIQNLQTAEQAGTSGQQAVVAQTTDANNQVIAPVTDPNATQVTDNSTAATQVASNPAPSGGQWRANYGGVAPLALQAVAQNGGVDVGGGQQTTDTTGTAPGAAPTTAAYNPNATGPAYNPNSTQVASAQPAGSDGSVV